MNTNSKLTKRSIVSLILIILGNYFLGAEVNAQEKTEVRKIVERDGKLPSGEEYKRLAKIRYGQMTQKNAVNKPNGKSSYCSKISAIEGQPEGFGQTFIWCKEDKEAYLVAFINVADEMGISIDGVNQGD